MENTPSFFSGMYALFKKECLRFYRVIGQTVLNPLINSSLYLLIFGVNLADRIANQNGVNYLQFIIPGLVAMGILNNSFQNASSSITISKFHGDLQDLKIVPLQPMQIVSSYALAATVRGLLVGGLIFLVGEIFYFVEHGQLLPIYNIFLFILFSILSGLTFGCFGVSVAIFANNFDQINAVGTFIILPLIYLGGVFFSIENMHPFWKTLSHANPLLYLINGIRYSVLGVSDIPPTITLVVSIVFLFLSGIVSARLAKTGSYTRF